MTALSNNAFAFGTGDFTIEAWVYLSNTTIPHIFSTGTGSSNIALYIDAGRLAFVVQTVAAYSTTATLSTNTWTHIAATRSSGTLRLFINGVVALTQSVTNSLTQAGASVGAQSSGAQFTTGYISNLRVVKDTAVYTSNFTPPTAPVTAIANTSLLLNFTNAGIVDSTAKNVLETVGNAQTSTGVKKFGTGSLAFDGNGDALTIPASQNFAFGTGNFTIEFWAYFNSIDEYDTIYIHGATNNTVQLFFVSGKLRYNNNGVAAVLDTTTTISTGQWIHIALSRSNGTARWFLNGTQDGSTSDSTNWSNASTNLTIGRDPNNGRDINGYIDDLRITKGIARYTANFTPPTSAHRLR